MGAIVLFDGVCNFCDSAVNFIIKRDPSGYFRYTPLQSEQGAELSKNFALVGRTEDAIDSVILIEDEKVYTHSTAALRIARRLSGMWPMLYGFIVLPATIRDAVYKLFARYRYRFFGKKDQCMMPTPEIRARFL